MKRIGKGLFSTAYRSGENGRVYLKSCDPIKECMAHGWFPKSDRFPIVEFSDVDGFDYVMDYLKPSKAIIKNLLPDERESYRLLRETMHCQSEHDNLVSRVLDFSKRFAELGEVIHEALDGCVNYGSDICFEISPRNSRAINGKLVLVDCFFIKSMAKICRVGLTK